MRMVGGLPWVRLHQKGQLRSQQGNLLGRPVPERREGGQALLKDVAGPCVDDRGSAA